MAYTFKIHYSHLSLKACSVLWSFLVQTFWLSCIPWPPTKHGLPVIKSQRLAECQDGIIARLIVLNNQLVLFINIINPLPPAPPAISYMMADRCFPDAHKASFVSFLHSHQAGCEDAWGAEKGTGGEGRKMLKAMNEHAFSKPKLCKPGRLLINLGFVENMAFRLQQTKGAPPLWLVLAREGLVAGNNRSLLIPLPLPGKHIPPLHGGVVVSSQVLRWFQALSSVWEAGICESLSESQLHHWGHRDSFFRMWKLKALTTAIWINYILLIKNTLQQWRYLAW